MKLSSKEKDVLTLIARGYSDKQIATILKNSIRTIQTHITSILKKLGAINRANAVIIYKEKYPSWKPIRSINVEKNYSALECR